MKAYQIALFLFSFNLILCYFTANPFLGSAYPDGVYAAEGSFNYTLSVSNETSVALGYDEDMINYSESNLKGYEPSALDIAGILGGVLALIGAILNSTLLLPFFLNNFGFDAMTITVLTGIVWFVYFYGIVQFVTGRGDRTMR